MALGIRLAIFGRMIRLGHLALLLPIALGLYALASGRESPEAYHRVKRCYR